MSRARVQRLAALALDGACLLVLAYMGMVTTWLMPLVMIAVAVGAGCLAWGCCAIAASLSKPKVSPFGPVQAGLVKPPAAVGRAEVTVPLPLPSPPVYDQAATPAWERPTRPVTAAECREAERILARLSAPAFNGERGRP